MTFMRDGYARARAYVQCHYVSRECVCVCVCVGKGCSIASIAKCSFGIRRVMRW